MSKDNMQTTSRPGSTWLPPSQPETMTNMSSNFNAPPERIQQEECPPVYASLEIRGRRANASVRGVSIDRPWHIQGKQSIVVVCLCIRAG
ncbi:hypothetical protein OUZ56_004652 [Daphnia magna]|uniref:Uncharacterized protein n=1 Tax=Daphnia magna TaxID=35525 RepID=A0ABQ9YQG0_9CRUS|nr:hypothetical protein OUZ56_004652 [Daphnia magna]